MSITLPRYFIFDIDAQMIEKIPSLKHWRKIATSRASFMLHDRHAFDQGRAKEPSSIPTRLQQWIQFVYTLQRQHDRIKLTGLIAAVLASCLALSILIMTAASVISDISTHKTASIVVVCGLVVSSISCVYFLVSACALEDQHCQFVALYLSMEAEISAIDLVDGLCMRKATRSEDNAFALQGILQYISGTRLPKPDYARPLGVIYKELTVGIMASTEARHFLLPAALSHAQGAPTWVPDWSLEFNAFWFNPALGTVATANSGESWKYDHEKDTLVIYGRSPCEVYDAFHLRESSGYYGVTEKGLHLQNLQTVLRFFKAAEALVVKDDTDTDRDPFQQVGAVCLSPCDNIEDDDYLRWLWFFQRERLNPPALIWSLLETEGTAFHNRLWPSQAFSRSFRKPKKLIDVHIALRDSLARSQRSLFVTSIYQKLGKPGNRFCSMGICRNNVKAGDNLLLIPGVPLPLITRPADSSTEHLISPAIVGGIMAGGLSRSEQSREVQRNISSVWPLETIRLS